MQKKESSKGFLPLSIDNDPHFTREVINPTIEWEYTEKEDHVHDWQGFLRIAEDGDYTITAEIDDNGYIDIAGIRVIELTGHNGRTTVTGQVSLTAGYHKIVLHHEDLIPLNEKYKNAQVFTPKINDEAMQIYKIMAPVNRMTKKHAEDLMGAYNNFNYTMDHESAWNIAGPAVAEYAKNDKGKYSNSCAIRVSLGFGLYGINLPSVPMRPTSGNNFVGSIPRKVVNGMLYPDLVNIPLFIRAEEMQYAFQSYIGASDYSSYSNYMQHVASNIRNEDVVVWSLVRSSGSGHIAMGVNGEGGDLRDTINEGQHFWVLYSPMYEDADETIDPLKKK